MDFDRLLLRATCTKDANFKEFFQTLEKQSMLPVEGLFFTRFLAPMRTRMVRKKMRRTDLVQALHITKTMFGTFCGYVLDRRRVIENHQPQE